MSDKQEWTDFLAWEGLTRDTIDFKKAYVDMAGGDVVAGLLLSQIVYWYLPDKQGRWSKLRVFKEGHYWIAKQRDEWWDEIRITPRQFDRASKILEDQGIIVKNRYRFDGSRTVHVRIITSRFLELWRKVKGEEAKRQEKAREQAAKQEAEQEEAALTTSTSDSKLPNGETEITKSLDRNNETVRPLTETTAETTTERKDSISKAQSASTSTSPSPINEETSLTDEDLATMWGANPSEVKRGPFDEPHPGTVIERLSEEFGDLEHLKANVSRARNLYKERRCWAPDGAEFDEDDLVKAIYQAEEITKAQLAAGKVKRPMPYFFSVLEDILSQHG
jgi:hypothetical protein